jgi:hypothetical protein
MDAIGVSAGDLTAFILAVSFAAGLNVYATVLTLGALGRFGWVMLPPGLGLLAEPWVIAASGTMFAGEFVLDKIPGFDLVWNALQTFVRVPLAAVLAYRATSHLSPGLQALATCLGAAVAMLAHGSKTSLRALITPSPEPVSNIALSAGEDVTAVGLSWVAVHHPIVAGCVATVLIAGSVAIGFASVRLIRRGWHKLLRRQVPQSTRGIGPGTPED